MNRLIIILILLLPATVLSQLKLEPMDYIHRIDNSEIYFDYTNKFKRNESNDHLPMDVHSAILPIIPNNSRIGYQRSPLTAVINKGGNSDSTAKSAFRFYPVADLMAGGEFGSRTGFLYTAGLGVGADLSFEKFFLTAKVMPYMNAAPYVADSIQTNFNMDVGSNRAFGGTSLFHRSEIIGVYRPNRFFTFLGGQGKNSFGDGYRSLLLSDNGPANPFVKMETTFGPVKYVNLYQMWFDNSTNPFDRSQDGLKFNTSHYLSWNVTRMFNIGIFETLVWNSSDTLLNRGFDFNYVNPIVFYRPVEYSVGSADNVLLGMNASVKLANSHNIYFQLILDEFLLSEIRARSRWWGNKYGVQFGYKSNNFITEGLYFQTEFNVVRPFTFSHKHSTEVYGNINSSVTHPLGANFWEVLGITSYKFKKLRITAKVVWTHFGRDTSDISYGGDIFHSYSDREKNHGHKIMQGERNNLLNETLTLQYPLIEKIGMYVNLVYNHRLGWTENGRNDQHYMTIGIQSRLWNRYSDY